MASSASPNQREHDAQPQSFIRVEIDRTTDPDETTALVTNLRRVLGDVRAATHDWPAMVEAMQRVLGELERRPAPVEVEDLSETRSLLEWMIDDHFTFLGFREYDLLGEPGTEQLVARPGTGLGLLSGSDDSKPSDSFARLPADIRAHTWDPILMFVTKANSRATVHRATYLDYVGVRKFDDRGEVEGEWRFLGLWTSATYSVDVRLIPLMRRKIAAVVERAGFPEHGHDEKNLFRALETYPRDELFQMDVDALYEIAIGTVQLQERKRVKLFTHRDMFRRFVSALVYIPRERYTTNRARRSPNVWCVRTEP